MYDCLYQLRDFGVFKGYTERVRKQKKEKKKYRYLRYFYIQRYERCLSRFLISKFLSAILLLR